MGAELASVVVLPIKVLHRGSYLNAFSVNCGYEDYISDYIFCSFYYIVKTENGTKLYYDSINMDIKARIKMCEGDFWGYFDSGCINQIEDRYTSSICYTDNKLKDVLNELLSDFDNIWKKLFLKDSQYYVVCKDK